jgi:hypothetical protein
MAGILSALGRRNQSKDPMRESAALTTVYLLEQNQKFEHYMRQKVDDLEARVAAQQARLSTREQTEEQELWAALESFEAIPDATPSAGLAVAEAIVVETIPDPAGESMAWVEGPEVDETAEPEEIPDYLALMSSAVTQPSGRAGIVPVEAAMVEFEALHPIIEPEDGLSSPQAASELLPDAIESESWPDQSYETFLVNRPESNTIEEVWPELAQADEVERLGQQPADNRITDVEETPVAPPTKTAASDVTSAPEAEQSWQTTLSGGQKGAWT